MGIGFFVTNLEKSGIRFRGKGLITVCLKAVTSKSGVSASLILRRSEVTQDRVSAYQLTRDVRLRKVQNVAF